jgi:hypothetical protein
MFDIIMILCNEFKEQHHQKIRAVEMGNVLFKIFKASFEQAFQIKLSKEKEIRLGTAIFRLNDDIYDDIIIIKGDKDIFDASLTIEMINYVNEKNNL